MAQLKEGFGALQAGRYADAVAVFSKLLKTEPGMTDVWQMYGDALHEARPRRGGPRGPR